MITFKWPSFWRIVLAGYLAFAANGETCLQDAILAENRVNLVRSTGEEQPVGFWQMDWGSGILMSLIAKILVEERLGFNARISGKHSSSSSSMYAVAGCANPTDYGTDPECSLDNTFIHHAVFEVWGYSKENLFQETYPDLEAIWPDGLGEVGYDGLDGMYIFSDTLESALNQTGEPLEYYRTYNPAWHTPWTFFSNWSDIDSTRLNDCSDSRLSSVTEIGKYLSITGDIDGVVETEDGYIAKCWYDKWWFSPACRDKPETCIPVMSGGTGWAAAEFMQRSWHHSMPIALAVSPEWSTICLEYRMLQYWWEPDTTFVQISPTQIVFPPTDTEELSEGIFRTTSEGVYLLKYAHNELQAASSRVYEVIARMSVTQKQITAMLVTAKTKADTLSYWDVACNWLKKYESTWVDWIPSPTECIAGQGLIDGNATFVSSEERATGCEWCEPGWMSVELGDTYICEQCIPGTSQNRPGQTSCNECEVGEYSDLTGSSECSKCVVGTYMAGTASPNCTSCPAGSTTQYLGATMPSDCICPEESYRPQDGGPCRPCPGGMVCEIASDIRHWYDGTDGAIPEATEGHMIRTSDPLIAYTCVFDKHCPGGRPGVCAAWRDPTSVACGVCMKGAYLVDGECRECEPGVDWLPFFLVGAACLFGICAIAWMVSREAIKQSPNVLTCVLLGGIVVTALQTLGIFGQLAFTWPGIVQSFLSAMRIISFDLEVLRMGCILEVDVVSQYVFQQFLPPMIIPFMFLTILFKKTFRTPETRLLIETTNAVGTLYNILFISICISSLAPLVCYRHPDDVGSSVRTAPSILCWVGARHTTMVVACFLSVVVVLLPFVAFVVYATWRYASAIRGTVENKFVIACRFLFVKFIPECYYFSLLLILRSLCISLIPIFFLEAAVQIVFLCGVMITFTVVQSRLRPWRSTVTNYVDSCMSSALLLLLIVGAVAADMEVADDTLNALAAAMLIIVLVVAAIGLLLGLVIAGCKFGPRYGRFICHHKADAAAQARYLKMLLQVKTSSQVFIDSDDLSDLDDLFAIVKVDVGTLVVYLTRDTLRRPWCAGEVTSAFLASKAKVNTVVTPSFLKPTEEDMAALDNYIDQSGCDLGAYCIYEKDIKVAFKMLFEPDILSVKMPADVTGGAKYEHIVADLLGNSMKTASRGPPMIPNDSGMVVISSNPQDDEAVAAASILSLKLQEKLMHTQALMCSLCDRDTSDIDAILSCIDKARAVIVLLSAGTIRCWSQLLVLLDVSTVRTDILQTNSGKVSGMASSGAVSDKSPMGSPVHNSSSDQNKRPVIPMTLSNFAFPDDQFYEVTLPSILPRSHYEAAELLRSFFRLIAMPFSTAASNQVLEAQVNMVSTRIPKFDPNNRKKSKMAITVGIMKDLQTTAEASHMNNPSISAAIQEQILCDLHNFPAEIVVAPPEATPDSVDWRYDDQHRNRIQCI